MFHLGDCLTLFVLISFGLADDITAEGVNNDQQHVITLRTGRKTGETPKNDEAIISAYRHFESKSILPSHDPEHKKVCWEKCNGGNVKNMREILLRKQNELLESRRSNNSQVRTRKSCGGNGCQSESSTIRPVQQSKGLKSGSRKNSKPTEFTKIFMAKASRSDSGNISMFQYVFAKNVTL